MALCDLGGASTVSAQWVANHLSLDFGYEGWKASLVRPDGMGTWCEEGRTVRFLVEIDTGTEPLKRLREKFTRYAALAATHAAHHHPNPTRAEPARAVLRLIRAATPPTRTSSRLLTDAEFTRLLQALLPDVWPEAAARRRDRLILTLARASSLSPEPLLALAISDVTYHPHPPALRLHLEQAPLDLPSLQGPPVECVVCALLAWRELLDLTDHPTTAEPRPGPGASTAPAPSPRPGEDFARLASHRLQQGQHLCQHPPHLAPATTDPLLRRLRRGGAIAATHPTPQTVKNLVHTYAHRAGLDTDGLTAFSLRRQPPTYPRSLPSSAAAERRATST